MDSFTPTKQSTTVETEYGPAFEVEYNTQGQLPITVWFRSTEWGDGETTGKVMSPDKAREMARVLEEYAQHADPASH